MKDEVQKRQLQDGCEFLSWFAQEMLHSPCFADVYLHNATFGELFTMSCNPNGPQGCLPSEKVGRIKHGLNYIFRRTPQITRH